MTVTSNRIRIATWLAALVATVIATTSVSAEATRDWDGDGIIEAGEDETAELARAAQNPVADLISLPFQNNTTFEFGPKDKPLNVLNIQPVLPFGLTDDWNLITRTIVPVVSQPQLAPGQDRKDGIGDVTFTAFLSPSNSEKLIWGAGPVLLMDTATDDRLGADEWGLGPSVVLLTMPGNWVIGSLFSQVWSIGGSGDEDVSLFTWQYFVNYNLPNGWYLTSSPILTANWKADKSGDTWTVPFGGGFGRVFRIEGLPPINIQAQGFYNVWRPDSVGRWSMRLQLQLMFPRRR